MTLKYDLPSIDAVAFLDKKVCDLPGNVGTDLDFYFGVNLAACIYRLNDRALGSFFSRYFHAVFTASRH